jgi:DNA-binding MarR family transcriptional regulator
MSNPGHPETIDLILANVAHLHRTRIHQLLETLELYQGQPPVLRELWKQEGLPQNELALRLKITPATVTRMLQRMEKSGFIRREPDPLDQRVTRVYLTAAGRAIQGQVESIFCTLEAETFGGLNPEELALLRGLLLHLRENLLRVTGEEPWK